MLKSLVSTGRKRWFVKLILASLLVQVVIFLIVKLVNISVVAPAQKRNQNTTEPTTTAVLSRSSTLPSSTNALNLSLVHPGSFDVQNETLKCTTARLGGLRFPICIYATSSDVHISGSVSRGAYFEQNEVQRFLRLLKADRRLQFVDIGANIGLWTLPAARLTQVLAVEPNPRSMARLAKAVHLGAVSSNVTLVHNAVSDVRTELHMGINPTNQGHAYLIKTTNCRTSVAEGPSCDVLKSRARTVLLDDLLPLMRSKSALVKVDVEGHEVHVFTEQSAGQFFDNIDVRVVYMEWMWCKLFSTETVQPMINFFRTRNYAAFDLSNLQLHKDFRRWPNDILFKKL